MASSDRYPFRAAEPELQLLGGKITGTGAASPTVSEGCNGFTVTWISTGLYEFTFTDTQQVWPLAPSIGATTITAVDGWTAHPEAYIPATRKLRISFFTEAQVLGNLAAATWANVAFLVKLTTTAG